MATPPFVLHCIELLATMGAVRTRRMFGGWGLYVDTLFVALIAFDRLYLKAGETTRAKFEAAGCEPFVHDAKNGRVALGYWTAPDEALDSPAAMQPWARLALQAAVAARAKAARTPVKKAVKKAPKERGRARARAGPAKPG